MRWQQLRLQLQSKCLSPGSNFIAASLLAADSFVRQQTLQQGPAVLSSVHGWSDLPALLTAPPLTPCEPHVSSYQLGPVFQFC